MQRCLDDPLDVASRALAQIRGAQRQLGEAQDTAKRLVELVRHARREVSQPIGAHHLRLEPLTPGFRDAGEMWSTAGSHASLPRRR